MENHLQNGRAEKGTVNVVVLDARGGSILLLSRLLGLFERRHFHSRNAVALFA